ncbi:MAG: hypothetical protein ABF809_10260, partial [Gluconobacter potus]
ERWNHTQGLITREFFEPSTFSKLKALLRARAERTVRALWDTVGALLPAFTYSECASFFTAAGYEPD